jgi:hypothetical protein
MALSSDVLPTPLWPEKTVCRPASSRRREAIPRPLLALVSSTGTPS